MVLGRKNDSPTTNLVVAISDNVRQALTHHALSGDGRYESKKLLCVATRETPRTPKDK